MMKYKQNQICIANETYDLIEVEAANSSITFFSYGARLVSWRVPDYLGKLDNIVLGHKALKDYFVYSNYFGASVGRVAGRIKNSQFKINGNLYQLEQNDGPHHLHGGSRGFDTRNFATSVRLKESSIEVIFKGQVRAWEDNYPGNLDVEIKYIYTENLSLTIEYNIYTDHDTVINPTNHTYFNLSGDLKTSILDHRIEDEQYRIYSIDKQVLPIGSQMEVQGQKTFKNFIHSNHQQFFQVNGLDHPFLPRNSQLSICEPRSKRILHLKTEPNEVVVIFTSNGMEFIDSFGQEFTPYCGFTLEAQYLPNEINTHPAPHSLIKANQIFHKKTHYHVKHNK